RIERRVIIRDGEGEGHHHMDQAEHLRTMLQLKPSQEAALTAYLAAVKPEHHHETIVEMSNHGDGAHGDMHKTTTQRLAEMETHLAEQAAQGKARIEATRKFYDQLEPSQKKVFDEMPMLMIGPMGPMMNMGNMRVMVNMEGMPPMHGMPPMPPMPPVPPAPPHL
ncbi:MAG: Spy/CpxP family protein refolding chaperone, partial [Phenylobacterium sp.]